ncbi:MAG: phosphoesterase [Tissierellia bacterium]|nr:phosphoesterase [Tissierellia bacterium]
MDNAEISKKERTNRYIITAISVILYQALFFMIERMQLSYTIIYHPLDDLIPFNEYFVIPYMIWFAYLFFALLLFIRNANRSDFNFFSALLFGGMTLCLMINILFPSMVDLRPLRFERDNIFVYLVKFIHKMDTPTNVCPSIHVYATLIAHMSISKLTELGKDKRVRLLSGIVSIAIILSTVFLKQHSIIDLFAGLAMGKICFDIGIKIRDAHFEEMRPLFKKGIGRFGRL